MTTEAFFKIPGKVGATTYETWIARTRQRKNLTFEEAKKEIDRMIELGELMPLEDL